MPPKKTNLVRLCGPHTKNIQNIRNGEDIQNIQNMQTHNLYIHTQQVFLEMK